MRDADVFCDISGHDDRCEGSRPERCRYQGEGDEEDQCKEKMDGKSPVDPKRACRINET